MQIFLFFKVFTLFLKKIHLFSFQYVKELCSGTHQPGQGLMDNIGCDYSAETVQNLPFLTAL
jgi:hypothetical protein